MIEPLHPPLPGGQDGAAVRLHPILTGEIRAPATLLERSGRPLSTLRAIGIGVPDSSWKWIPVPAFLIEHPGAGLLLVDTGLHPRAEVEPRETMGRVSDRLYEFRVRSEETIAARLRQLGFVVDDLKLIVMTHLHSDHASGIRALPDADLVLDRREWGAAGRRLGFLSGYDRSQLPEERRWHLLDFEAASAGPHESFERVIDLLGDGSIRLLATPGHTAGHLSVLLRLRKQEVLLAADAAYTKRTISEGSLPGLADDLGAFRSSLAQIRDYVERFPDALVIPGHDAEFWTTLEVSYE